MHSNKTEYIHPSCSTCVFILYNLAVAVIIENFEISDMLHVTRTPGIRTSVKRLARDSWAKVFA